MGLLSGRFREARPLLLAPFAATGRLSKFRPDLAAIHRFTGILPGTPLFKETIGCKSGP